MPKPLDPPQVNEQWSMLGLYLVRDAGITPEPNTPEGQSALEGQIAVALRALAHLAFRYGLDWDTLMSRTHTQLQHDLSVTEADGA